VTRAYSPFINFSEVMKEGMKCDTTSNDDDDDSEDDDELSEEEV
jgi:hypothetical protein